MFNNRQAGVTYLAVFSTTDQNGSTEPVAKDLMERKGIYVSRYQ
jgi:hypothetical protein